MKNGKFETNVRHKERRTDGRYISRKTVERGEGLKREETSTKMPFSASSRKKIGSREETRTPTAIGSYSLNFLSRGEKTRRKI